MVGNNKSSSAVYIINLEAELLLQIHRCDDFQFRGEMRILTRFEAVLL